MACQLFWSNKKIAGIKNMEENKNNMGKRRIKQPKPASVASKKYLTKDGCG